MVLYIAEGTNIHIEDLSLEGRPNDKRPIYFYLFKSFLDATK